MPDITDTQTKPRMLQQYSDLSTLNCSRQNNAVRLSTVELGHLREQ